MFDVCVATDVVDDPVGFPLIGRSQEHKLGRTLEHFSTVLGLSLKGQRMVIALGVQDFVDRKDTTYVGFKKGHTGGLKFGQGLDSLTDLPLFWTDLVPRCVMERGSHAP
eukprot:s192_g12.t1